jgi:DNA-binding SARP family transcriptional activator/streptogramin lyase
VDGVRIQLLGPVELWVGDEQAALGGPKQRTLLAALALEAGHTVSRDRLAEALWGINVPDAYPSRLHTIASRLRAAVRDAGGPPEIIESSETGYRLSEDVTVDAAAAAASLARTRDLRSDGKQPAAARACAEALALWHGDPLSDLQADEWAGGALRHFEDMKLALLEEWFDARLEAGESKGLVDDLQSACAAAPLRERMHAQLMLALVAAGRRPDALAVYDRIRRALAEELGIEPGVTLREAHAVAIGADDAPPLPRASRGRRPAVVGIAALVTVAAMGAARLLVTSPGEPTRSHYEAGAIVLQDSGSGRVLAQLPSNGTLINAEPGGLVLSGQTLWAISDRGTVTQVDVPRRSVIGTTPLGLTAGPGSMAVGLGAAWISDSGSDTIYRINTGTTAAEPFRLPPVGKHPGSVQGIAVAHGSVWAVQAAGAVDRISSDGRLERRVHVPDARFVVAGAGGIWLSSLNSGRITKLDPRSGRIVARARLPRDTCCLAIGGGSVWATSKGRGLLWQLSPDGTIQAAIHVPTPALELAYADGAVWVSGYLSGKVTRVDAATLTRRTFQTGQGVAGMAAGSGVVAFSTFATPRSALANIHGKVARLVLGHNAAEDVDPATPGVFGDRDADWQQLALTCLSLYEYRSGTAVPFAATAARQSPNGREWTFLVRSGFGFSPPSTELVDAATFAQSIQRTVAPTLRAAPALSALRNVVGVDAYRNGLAHSVAGISASGAKLTFRLVRPDADFPQKLAAPYFCAVPKHTPAPAIGVSDPFPSAGPYYIAASSGGGGYTVLRRNPHFPRHAPSSFAAFVVTSEIDQRHALDLVRHGRADYAAFYPPEDDGFKEASRLGATSDALGIRLHRSRRPRRPDTRDAVAELFARRLGCTEYTPLYAGVDLKRLCVARRAG